MFGVGHQARSKVLLPGISQVPIWKVSLQEEVLPTYVASRRMLIQ